ncbi:hypothetical protein BHE74_00048763 [Ensete ventricosum]|nr:hypothetical protein BHE74_00048763 [Ensete ventricosum]
MCDCHLDPNLLVGTRCHGSKRSAQEARDAEGKSSPTDVSESAQSEVEVIHMEASAKRPVRSPIADQATTGRPASEFDRGMLHPMLAKNLYILPSEVLTARAGHHYQMALLDRVHDSGRLVTHMGNQSSLLEVKLEKMKTERDLE